MSGIPLAEIGPSAVSAWGQPPMAACRPMAAWVLASQKSNGANKTKQEVCHKSKQVGNHKESQLCKFTLKCTRAGWMIPFVSLFCSFMCLSLFFLSILFEFGGGGWTAGPWGFLPWPAPPQKGKTLALLVEKQERQP